MCDSVWKALLSLEKCFDELHVKKYNLYALRCPHFEMWHTPFRHNQRKHNPCNQLIVNDNAKVKTWLNFIDQNIF